MPDKELLAQTVEQWIQDTAGVGDASFLKDLAACRDRGTMLPLLAKQGTKFEHIPALDYPAIGHDADGPPPALTLPEDDQNWEAIKKAAQAKAYLLLDEYIKGELKNSNNLDVLKAIAGAGDDLRLNQEPLPTQLAVIGVGLYGALSDTDKAKQGHSDAWRKEASNRIKAILLSKIDAIADGELQQLAALANTDQGALNGQAATIEQAFNDGDIDADVIKGLAHCDGYDDLQKAAAKRIAKGVKDNDAAFQHGDSEDKAIQLAALASTDKAGLNAGAIAGQLGNGVSDAMITAIKDKLPAPPDDGGLYADIQAKAEAEFKAYLVPKFISDNNQRKLQKLAELTAKNAAQLAADKNAIAHEFDGITDFMLEKLPHCPNAAATVADIQAQAKAQIAAHIDAKINGLGGDPSDAELKALALLATKSKADIQASAGGEAADIAHLDDGTLDENIIKSLANMSDAHFEALQKAAAKKIAAFIQGKVAGKGDQAFVDTLATTAKGGLPAADQPAVDAKIKAAMIQALSHCEDADYQALQGHAAKAVVEHKLANMPADPGSFDLDKLQAFAEANDLASMPTDELVGLGVSEDLLKSYKAAGAGVVTNFEDQQKIAAKAVLINRLKCSDDPIALKAIATAESVLADNEQSIKRRLGTGAVKSLGFSRDGGDVAARRRLRQRLPDDLADYKQAARLRSRDLLKAKLAETAVDVSKRDETITHLKTLLDNQNIDTGANLWTQHGRDAAFKAVLGMPDAQAQALVEALVNDDDDVIKSLRGAIAEQVVDLAVDKALDEADLTDGANPIKALIEADTADNNDSDFLKVLANDNKFGLHHDGHFDIKDVLATKAQQDKLRQQAAIALFKKSFSVHEFDALSVLLEANQNGPGFASALLDNPTDDAAFKAKYGQVERANLKAIFHDPDTQTALRDALKSHAESLRAVKATGLGQQYAGVGEQYQKSMYFPATHLEHARQITQLSDIGTPLSYVGALAQSMNRALAMHQSDQRIGDVAPQFSEINHGSPNFGQITRSSQFHLKAASVSQVLFGDGRATAKLVAAYEDGTHTQDIEKALSKLSRYVDKADEANMLTELRNIRGWIGDVPGMSDAALTRVADNLYFQNLSRRIYGNTEHVAFLKRAYAAGGAAFLDAVHPFVHANRRPGAASDHTQQGGHVADIADHEKFLVHDAATNGAKDALDHLATLAPDAPAIDTEEHAKQVRREAAIRYLAHPPTKAYVPYATRGTGEERPDAKKRNKSIDDELKAAKTLLDKDLEALLSPKIQQYLDPEAIERNIYLLETEVGKRWDELLPALMANKQEGQKRLRNLEGELTKRAMIMSALAKQKVALEGRKQTLEQEVVKLKTEHLATHPDLKDFKLPEKLKEYKTKLDTALATCRQSYHLHDRLHRRLERLHLRITQHDVGGILKSERWASRRVKASELDTVLKQPALGTAAPSNLTLGGVSKWGASSELLPSDEVMLHEKTVPIDVSGESKLSVQRITQPDGTMKMYATQHTPGAAEENDRVKRVSIATHPNETEMMNMSMDMVIEFIEQNGLPSEENPLIISGRDDKARVATYVALKHLLNGDKTFGGEFSDCKKHVYMPGMDEKAIKKHEKAYAKSLKSGPEFSKRQREVQAIAKFDKGFKSKGTQERKQEISKIREQLGLTEDEVSELQPPSRMNGGPN